MPSLKKEKKAWFDYKGGEIEIKILSPGSIKKVQDAGFIKKFNPEMNNFDVKHSDYEFSKKMILEMVTNFKNFMDENDNEMIFSETNLMKHIDNDFNDLSEFCTEKHSELADNVAKKEEEAIKN